MAIIISSGSPRQESTHDPPASSLKGKLNAKNKYGLSEGELGTDSDELCLEPTREEEPCQIS